MRTDLLALFDQMNGYGRLKDLLAQKLPEMRPKHVKRVFAQLVEVACDELNCSLRIDERLSQQTGIR